MNFFKVYLSNTDNLRGLANVAMYVAMLAVNALSNYASVYGGKNNAEIADLYMNYFTPAGWAFSIWGLIYLGWGAFALYSLVLPSGEVVKRGVGWYFVAMCALNMVWLVVFSLEYIAVSLVIMLGYLAVLVVMYYRVRGPYLEDSSHSFLDRLFVLLPLSLQFGWITVATILNVVLFLVSLGVKDALFGVDGRTWSALLSAAVFLVSTANLTLSRDVPYTLVLAWGVAAVGARFHAEPVVAWAAFLSAAGMVGGAVPIAARAALEVCFPLPPTRKANTAHRYGDDLSELKEPLV